MSSADRLTYLRKQKGLSQADLAEALDVSRQAISRWEVGATLPSTENLLALRDLYGVTLDELLYGEDPPPPSHHRQARRKRAALLTALIAALVLASVLLTAHIVQRQDDAIFDAAFADAVYVPGRVAFSETVRSTAGDWRSPSFSTVAQEGNRLCVWFQNTTGEAVTVYLRRIDQGPQTIVAQLSVPGHAQDAVVYHHRTADRGSYLLMVEATASGGLIAGTVALTQCEAAP